jgi:hypothetical protein
MLYLLVVVLLLFLQGGLLRLCASVCVLFNRIPIGIRRRILTINVFFVIVLNIIILFLLVGLL